MNTLKRGVTLYSAKGGYDKTEHTELVTIMATNEYKKLLYYLQESGIEAFVTVSTVNKSLVLGIIRKESKSLDKFKDIPKQDVFSLFLGKYPIF